MGLSVVMMGPPGAGKGTQASRLALARGVPHISTGDMLREGIKGRNPVALEAKARMDRGELADDAAIIAIVRDRLERPDASGFVLDGFPRTVVQAQALDGLVESRGREPLVVVDIVVPEEELVRRLASRRICESCGTSPGPTVAQAVARCLSCGGELVQRVDDSAGIVIERLRVYQRSTRPVLDFYGGRATFRAVDGSKPPDEVAVALAVAIDDIRASVVPARAKV